MRTIPRYGLFGFAAIFLAVSILFGSCASAKDAAGKESSPTPESYQEQGYTIRPDGTITEYFAEGGDMRDVDMIIPATIAGIAVKAIGNWVFTGTEIGPPGSLRTYSINSIVIPDGVVSIGKAFQNNYSLTTITLPANVQIHSDAFRLYLQFRLFSLSF